MVAIQGKKYIADHSKLLLLNSLSEYLAEDDFLLFISDKIELNSLKTNLSIRQTPSSFNYMMVESK